MTDYNIKEVKYMQKNAEYITKLMNEDFKALLDKKKAYALRPDVQAYLGIENDIKSMKGEIGDDMLNVYLTHGIQSIKGDVATVYVKDEYAIKRDRLTSAQIVAMFDYNPDAFKVTDKALRDCIELAKLARANGDMSPGIDELLNLDLDSLRGPVEHTAIVRMAKY